MESALIIIAGVSSALSLLSVIYVFIIKAFVLSKGMDDEQYAAYVKAFSDSSLLNDPVVFLNQYSYLKTVLKSSNSKNLLFKLILSHRLMGACILISVISGILLIAGFNK